MYANDHEVEVATDLGYTHNRSPKTGSDFSKGRRRVWGTYRGWQTADLVNNHFTNHKMFDSRNLVGALKRPLEDEEPLNREANN